MFRRGCHEDTDSGLGFFAQRSQPEQLAGPALTVRRAPPADGGRVVIREAELVIVHQMQYHQRYLT